MNNIKLVISDLDGVLLSNNHISNEAIERINKLKSRGILFCVASGRTFNSAERVVLNKLRIYFILENGSIIGDNISNISKKYKEWNSAIKDEIVEVNNLQKLFSEKYRTEKKDIMFSITSKEDISIPKKFSKVTKKRNMEVLDFFPISAGKENGTRFLTKKLGIKLSETLFIGDSYNDLELLKIVGFCGCPKNAVKEVKDLVRNREGIISNFETTKGFLDVLTKYIK